MDFFGDWTVVESSDLLSDCAGLLNGFVVEPWDFLWTELWGPNKLLGIGLWGTWGTTMGLFEDRRKD